MSRNMDNFDDDEEFEVIALLVSTSQISGFGAESSNDCESERGLRKRNKQHDFKAALERFDRIYFSSESLYSNNDFERRFCMPKAVFITVEKAVIGKEEFLDGKEDATGTPGASSKAKLIAVLRILAYSMSFNQVNELCELSEKPKSTWKTFMSFLDICLEVIESSYLRKPNEEDLKRIMSIMASYGSPGCIAI